MSFCRPLVVNSENEDGDLVIWTKKEVGGVSPDERDAIDSHLFANPFQDAEYSITGLAIFAV